jgi:hypothetical protein
MAMMSRERIRRRGRAWSADDTLRAELIQEMAMHRSSWAFVTAMVEL